MKVKLGVKVAGKNLVANIGDVVELPEAKARELIAKKFAAPVDDTGRLVVPTPQIVVPGK